ncbi:MAG: hypothetical protein ACRD3R_07980, partial [Terriglobales bacterium]
MNRNKVAAAALAWVLCFAVSSALGADAAKVKIFDATELPLDRYTVVKRIWTQSWRSAFWVPTYDQAADAIASLTSK